MSAGGGAGVAAQTAPRVPGSRRAETLGVARGAAGGAGPRAQARPGSGVTLAGAVSERDSRGPAGCGSRLAGGALLDCSVTSPSRYFAAALRCERCRRGWGTWIRSGSGVD